MLLNTRCGTRFMWSIVSQDFYDAAWFCGNNITKEWHITAFDNGFRSSYVTILFDMIMWKIQTFNSILIESEPLIDTWREKIKFLTIKFLIKGWDISHDYIMWNYHMKGSKSFDNRPKHCGWWLVADAHYSEGKKLHMYFPI